MSKPALFGWDHQTWMRAFAWAGKPPVKVYDVTKLTPEQWAALTEVHGLWMRTNGDPAGPKGSIIL